jgi:hypothetical protein
VGGGVQLCPLGTAAINRPIVSAPGDNDDGEKLVEWLAGETEILGENLPQCRFVHHNLTCCPYANPGRHGGKPTTNRLSYGTAMEDQYCVVKFLHRVQNDWRSLEVDYIRMCVEQNNKILWKWKSNSTGL